MVLATRVVDALDDNERTAATEDTRQAYCHVATACNASFDRTLHAAWSSVTSAVDSVHQLVAAIVEDTGLPFIVAAAHRVVNVESGLVSDTPSDDESVVASTPSTPSPPRVARPASRRANANDSVPRASTSAAVHDDDPTASTSAPAADDDDPRASTSSAAVDDDDDPRGSTSAAAGGDDDVRRAPASSGAVDDDGGSISVASPVNDVGNRRQLHKTPTSSSSSSTSEPARKRRLLSTWAQSTADSHPPACGQKQRDQPMDHTGLFILPKTARRPRTPWTSPEELDLVRGVQKYKAGNWAKMHKEFFKKSSRSPTDLKDKWDNLNKKSNAAHLRRLYANLK